jgi:phage tail sheath protein FI
MGNVTTDSRVTSQWWAAHHSRIVMALNARGHAIAETYVHRGLDGKGVVLSEFNGRLASLCADFYRDGALYGAEPAEAFRVNTGPDVNPRAQLAAGILAADLEVVVSPAAEVVRLRIAKHPTDTALAA